MARFGRLPAQSAGHRSSIFCRMRSAFRITSSMHISCARHGLSPISASLRAARMVAENIVERMTGTEVAKGRCQSCTEPVCRESVRYCTKHLAMKRESSTRQRGKNGIPEAEEHSPALWLRLRQAARGRPRRYSLSGPKTRRERCSTRTMCFKMQQGLPERFTEALCFQSRKWLRGSDLN